nr:hypothetical protein Iba_chr02bCG12430 [Ipomoea batatas]
MRNRGGNGKLTSSLRSLLRQTVKLRTSISDELGAPLPRQHRSPLLRSKRQSAAVITKGNFDGVRCSVRPIAAAAVELGGSPLSARPIAEASGALTMDSSGAILIFRTIASFRHLPVGLHSKLGGGDALPRQRQSDHDGSGSEPFLASS